MSNRLKRLIHRRQDKKDLQVFANIVRSTLTIIRNMESILRESDYSEPQFDDLMIVLNNQLHENLRLYINHKYAKPSQILSAEDILMKCENLHNLIMGFKRVTEQFLDGLPFKISSVHQLPPEVYDDIMKPYTQNMKSFALSGCNIAHKAFILLTYDIARIENGTDIISEYYDFTKKPDIKISINKEEIMKQAKQSDCTKSKSDKINNIQKGREK